jgi:hypothetical protein
MSILDGLLGQVAGNVNVGSLASKLGMESGQVEKAMASLAKSHSAPGDTVQAAAAETGIGQDKLSQIVDQMGGEGGLGKFSQMLNDDQSILGKAAGFLDRDGDGNPLNDIAGMAKGLFGKS